MVVEGVLVVQDAAYVAAGADGAVPADRDDGFAFGHVDQIGDGVVVDGEGFGSAAVYDVEEVDVVVPGTDLYYKRGTAKD